MTSGGYLVGIVLAVWFGSGFFGIVTKKLPILYEQGIGRFAGDHVREIRA